MTRFVDVSTLRRLVNRVGAGPFLCGLGAAMRDDFRRWETFEKSARLASHSKIGVIELMPIANRERFAFKYVNGHPANPSKGLSTVMAFGVLADVETGFPMLLSEMTLTTAFRTAAASAVAAEVLARPGSSVMGMIGCGAQAEFQAIAFHELAGVDEFRIYDIHASAMDKLARNLSCIPELKVTAVESSADAASGADIVTTCTADKALATVLTLDMVEPGMHINAVGGDCPGKTELHLDVLCNAKIFVEYEPQTRIEGDIQQLPGDHPVHELWTVIAGKAAGRESEEQVTIFDSVGFALEDYSALRYVHELAVEFDEGEDIELVPDLRDPRDLFGTVVNRTRTAAEPADKSLV